MSASRIYARARRSKLWDILTADEQCLLYDPVTDADFEAWSLPVPVGNIPLPWRTRGEFMLAVFFDYEKTAKWCVTRNTEDLISVLTDQEHPHH